MTRAVLGSLPCPGSDRLVLLLLSQIMLASIVFEGGEMIMQGFTGMQMLVIRRMASPLASSYLSYFLQINEEG